ncbi:hypothetical protein BJ969_001874 [Saccharopolyspora gloriosae]|uniref:Uncharacterized protein n=1 Tax=Saccharopolyspora gloriosae TaxID=455344 RepID=A0A840N9C6_9PSEU|nr:hypothetical protein [Saccharopolyspora gloriosae]
MLHALGALAVVTAAIAGFCAGYRFDAHRTSAPTLSE